MTAITKVVMTLPLKSFQMSTMECRIGTEPGMDTAEAEARRFETI